MKQIKWFDRKFDFSFQQNIFPSIMERLEGTPLRLEFKLSQIPKKVTTLKLENKWSINQNIAHLTDLEYLWQNRLNDILNNEKYFRETDLTNSQIDAVDYNTINCNDLIESFTSIRKETLKTLNTLSEDDIFKSALHPRLNKPMRVMDLFLFVAEHDDHHLVQISHLNKTLSK